MKEVAILYILQLAVTCNSSPVPVMQQVVSTASAQWYFPTVSTIWKVPVVAAPYFLYGNQFLPYYFANVNNSLSPELPKKKFKFLRHSHPVVTCHGKDGRPFDGFPCGDGVCVPVKWVCDGEKDCKGGADESHCGECERDEIHCRMKGVDVCIPPQSQCDGRRDCQDGSDEDPELCESHCEFRCRNGRECIASSMVCNWQRDCSDGSDELNCFDQSPQNQCYSEYEFQCYDSLHEDTWSHCIPRAWICDGHDDCPRGEDESIYTCSSKKNYYHY